MYTRLWWKDTRQFWPIWAVLVLAAAATQSLMLSVLGPQARYSELGGAALMWAGLYALAAGAAAFAGERETGTLQLLDILPIDRRVVWSSKVSFAFVTTLVLTLGFQLMALLGTQRWDPQSVLSVWSTLGLGAIVLLALGWGLFWSSILRRALGAAVIAIGCTGLSFIYLVDESNYWDGWIPSTRPILEFVLILATLIASHVLFTRSIRSRRARLEFQSPFMVIPLSPAGSHRVQLQVPVATMPVLEAPSLARLAVETREALMTIPVPRRSWIIEARNLAWQTVKEGLKSWCLLAAVVLVYPMLSFLTGSRLDAMWLVLTSIGVTVAAGANTFGLENRARTQRFLTHHGAQAGLIWLVKLTVWGTGLAIIWGLLAVIAWSMPMRGVVQGEWLLVALILPLSFTVGLLCGMAIPRGITAFVIAIVISAGLAGALLIFTLGGMMPVLSILFVPVILLFVSWAWSGDWMLDRPAPGRWLRLGVLLSTAFGLFASGYVGYRIKSVRDVGQITPPASWIDAGSSLVRADLDAAELYRTAGIRLIVQQDAKEFLDQNREALDLIRQAAARPECHFNQPEKLTLIDQDPRLAPPYGAFMHLVAMDVRERQEQGDLAGAWNDIVVMFRMARHFGSGDSYFQSHLVLVAVERDALGLAMEWAIAKGQTPERLEKALAAYRDLPKITPITDAVRAEANLVENTLDLPASKFRDWLVETNIGTGVNGSNKLISYLWIDAMSAPWERARARRINRLVAAKAIEAALHEPAERRRLNLDNLDHDPEIEFARTTTPSTIKFLFFPAGSWIEANDRNEVGRRALIQVLAIRAWQLRHNGRFPDRLDALVPEELSTLPNDPYTGGSFAYTLSQGQYVFPLRYVLNESGALPNHDFVRAQSGSWLLYSGGPLSGEQSGTMLWRKNDILVWRDLVFAIPPVEDNNKDQTQDHEPTSSTDRSKSVGQSSPAKP
jgi:hypothetical protein